MCPTKITAAALLLGAVLPLSALAYGNGVVGFSGKIGGQTCSQCHTGTASTAPTVAFTS